MPRRIEIPPRDKSAPVRIPQGIPKSSTQSKKPSGVFNERHTSSQDVLYRDWVENQTPLLLVFSDATTLVGTLQGYDTYALHLEDENGIPTVVFKQSLRLIRPS